MPRRLPLPAPAPTRRPRISPSTVSFCVALLGGAGLIAFAALGDGDAEGRPLGAMARRAHGQGAGTADELARRLAARRLARLDLTRPVAVAPLAHVHGVVLDLDGVPLAGATVTAEAAGDLVSPPAPTTTDADGRFALAIEIAHGGALDGHVIARSGALVGTAPLRVAEGGESDDLEIQLARALEVAGVVRAGGVPVAGAEIRVTRLGSLIEHPAPVARAWSSTDGQFSLPVFGAGVYQVEAALGVATALSERPVQLLDGVAPAGIAIELPALESIDVRVRDRAGAPLGGVAVKHGSTGELIARTGPDGVARFVAARGERAWIRLVHTGYLERDVDLYDGDRDAVLDSAAAVRGEIVAPAIGVTEVFVRSVADPSIEHVARLGAPGDFELTVPPGEYEVVAAVRGAGESIPRRVAVLAGETAALGAVEVRAPFGRVIGVVRDAEGAPVPGAYVSLSRASNLGYHTATADDAGRFVVPAVDSGTYLVNAYVGEQQAQTEVAVVAGQEAEVELVPPYVAEPEIVADVEHPELEDGEGEGEGDDAVALADDEYEPDEEPYAYEPSYEPSVQTMWTMDGLVVTGAGYTDDGPGDLEGLLPGDVIVTIDGRRFDQDTSLIGPRGAVRVGVIRPATGERFERTLRRVNEYMEPGC